MIADVNRLVIFQIRAIFGSTLYYETLSNLLKIYEDHGLYEPVSLYLNRSKKYRPSPWDFFGHFWRIYKSSIHSHRFS